jgi:lactate dehydrogenase-like 2-hydroxyacid dehydrogenase
MFKDVKTGSVDLTGLQRRNQRLLVNDRTAPGVNVGPATPETRYNMAACAVDNLIDALNGKVEKNCVNPQVK